MTVKGSGTPNLSGMRRGFLARIIAFPVSAVASFVTTGLIIRSAGADLYGVIALVASLFLLLPFADLGTGAIIVNAYSDPALTREQRLAVMRRVVRVLLFSAGAIAIGGWLGTGVWSWGRLLGVAANTDRVDVATALSVTLYAVSIPFSIGARLLVGLHRAATMTALAPVGSLAALGLVLLLVAAGTQPIWLTLALPAGQLATQVLTFAVGLRVAGLQPRDLWGATNFSTRQVLTTSMPMVVIMVTLPFALQSHRIVLSILSSPAELAAYSLAMQFYQPIWSFITAAATPLWPLWASVRNSQRPMGPLFRKSLLILGGLAIAALSGLLVVGQWLGALVSGGQIRVGLSLLAATGILLVVQATQQAPGMFLTDSSGLRFQAVGAALATAVSVGGSVALVGRWGSGRPSLVTAAGIGLAQTIPGLMFVRARLARRQVVEETTLEEAR